MSKNPCAQPFIDPRNGKKKYNMANSVHRAEIKAQKKGEKSKAE